MTQKELLYVEDAIGHETNIISIIENSISNLENGDFISFMENEINKHKTIKNNLMNLLRGKTNGW